MPLLSFPSALFQWGSKYRITYSFLRARASWSGQLVPRPLHWIPCKRVMASWIFMPATRAPIPCRFPLQPAVKRTVFIVSPDVSISMSSEQTRAQVWKVVWRMPFSVLSDISVTSNIGACFGWAKIQKSAGGYAPSADLIS